MSLYCGRCLLPLSRRPCWYYTAALNLSFRGPSRLFAPATTRTASRARALHALRCACLVAATSTYLYLSVRRPHPLSQDPSRGVSKYLARRSRLQGASHSCEFLAMVAVAAGRRAGGVGGRRRSGCGAGQAQQKLLAIAVAARFAEAVAPPSAEASRAGSGGCCVELLECLLGALSVNAAPPPAQHRRAVHSIRRRRPRGGGSADDRHADAPSGRIAGNGASASAAASLYTMQGRKGVNQDAMVVWEVQLIPSTAFPASSK